ncbi:MAG: site-specific integrase [Afipia sp.]|uniref:Integrase n=1 Tax=Afipia massiliensis TaxID=211460 RepID=A0A840MZB0_9BRAD|nr:site-specific integrase [Afipia massiliensis]MBB5051547.1 integrase [Afipia massiliensis]TXJ25049.1 MAG: site-specific integrase [Afipia sp.]
MLHRLTATQLKSFTERGRYADGGGLWFQVSAFNTRAWIFQYRIGGRVRQKGLGPYPQVGLEKARKKAGKCRDQLDDGIDPIADTKAQARKKTTFKQMATAYVEAQAPGWRNAKHRQQWTNTLTTYVYPDIGDEAVCDVDKTKVLKVLKPVWAKTPETAERIRGRIEKILDYAKSNGAREGDNPAAWRGNLAHDFPGRSRLARVKNHEAMPYTAVPGFMTELRKRDSISARALEFTILTAARTGAVIGATWHELDLAEKLWTVPPDRAGVKIEGNKPKVVPLCDRAITILKALPREDGNPHVFVGGTRGKGISNMAMLELVRGMVRKGMTVHGFRSSFKDWAAECTRYENIVSEAALWHAVADKVEAAYRRGDLLEKRRRLMRDWMNYCAQPPAKRDGVVTPLRKGDLA